MWTLSNMSRTTDEAAQLHGHLPRAPLDLCTWACQDLIAYHIPGPPFVFVHCSDTNTCSHACILPYSCNIISLHSYHGGRGRCPPRFENPARRRDLLAEYVFKGPLSSTPACLSSSSSCPCPSSLSELPLWAEAYLGQRLPLQGLRIPDTGTIVAIQYTVRC